MPWGRYLRRGEEAPHDNIDDRGAFAGHFMLGSRRKAPLATQTIERARGERHQNQYVYCQAQAVTNARVKGVEW
jgi:hypothetical protein